MWRLYDRRLLLALYAPAAAKKRHEARKKRRRMAASGFCFFFPFSIVSLLHFCFLSERFLSLSSGQEGERERHRRCAFVSSFLALSRALCGLKISFSRS